MSLRVHIVCTGPESERILPRKARMLAGELGWTLDNVPDPEADVNYAFPYLEMRGRHDYRMAAFFTHREDNSKKKVEIWDAQAARSALRVCQTPMYVEDLEQHGTTFRVRPPLDREFFAPSKQEPHVGAPKVGVSGYVYGGGRKGEALVRDVVRTEVGQRLAWDAIGRGWPIPTHGIPYAKLAEWYSDLDVYFCSSLIEGVPYGPLEALACGTAIVIPRGVGLLDELPDIPGIVRYERGDAADATRALDELSKELGDVHRDELRAATEPYTIAGWVHGHAEAFASLAAPPVSSHADKPAAREARRGIYVVAYGDGARKCAQRLIKSVREHMPGVPVAVASETPLEEADLHVEHPDSDLGGRIAKTRMYDMTPASWEEVLYLDADTELTADVSFLFDALSAGWELVLTKDVDDYDLIYSLWRRDSTENELGRKAIGSGRALQLAGGVMGFRRTKATKRFFSNWVKEWFKLGRRDQGALIRALYSTPVRMLVLGNEWNSFTGVFRGETAGILHYRGGPARRVRGWRVGRLDDPYRMRGTSRLQSYWESGKAPLRRSPLKDPGKDKRSSYWGTTGLPRKIPSR